MYSRDIDSLAGAHCLVRQTTTEEGMRRGAGSRTEALFERIVQNVLHAAVPEFAAAEGCRHNGQRKNSMKNVRHFELSSIYLTLNF